MTEPHPYTVRLCWLEMVGFSTRRIEPNENNPRPTGVQCWLRLDGSLGWTARYVGSEFASAREAIDAAMKRDAEERGI